MASAMLMKNIIDKKRVIRILFSRSHSVPIGKSIGENIWKSKGNKGDKDPKISQEGFPW